MNIRLRLLIGFGMLFLWVFNIPAPLDAKNGENGRNSFSDISSSVFQNYKKTGHFQLYNTKKVPIYESPTTASKVVQQVVPTLLQGTKRDGNWFWVKIKGGYGWVYWDDQVVKVRELESVHGKLQFHNKLFLYTQPFETYKTNQVLSGGTYEITEKAGDWYYVNGKGWITTTKATFVGVISRLPLNRLQIKNQTVPIKQSIVPISENVRPGAPLLPRYITIHNTANTAIGAGAAFHSRYLHGIAADHSRWASWHFTVDDHEVYQHLPLNEHAWHAGDNEGPGNYSSIAIEIAMNSDGNYARSQENAAYLTAAILHAWHVPYNQIADWVVPHQKWSGKNCPSLILAQPKGFAGFINQVKQAYLKEG